MYEEENSTYLSKINYSFISVVNNILGIETELKWSTDYQPSGKKGDKILDICKKSGATDYYSGPAAKSYMDEVKFEQEGIKVHYFDYSGYPEYIQQYGPFEHGVSILDLLF